MDVDALQTEFAPLIDCTLTDDDVSVGQTVSGLTVSNVAISAELGSNFFGYRIWVVFHG